MKMSTVFPSKHLRAEDIGTARPVVTISHLTMEKLGDNEKPVLYFQGKDKGVVLNKTNTAALIDILNTDDSDAWKGRKVLLYMTKVDYQGKRVAAIRIDAAPSKAQPAPVVREPGSDDDEVSAEDISF